MKISMSSALRGCCIALAALSLACGTSSTTSTSSTGGSGATGGTTSAGTTTGLACFLAGAACPNGTNCCAGLTCDTSTFKCITAGATNGGTSSGGQFSDPCPLSAEGGACGTSIDCQAGLFCVAGLCTTPDTTPPQCTPDGVGPSAGAPCCETNDNGACVQWQACIQQGRSCSDGGTCCNNTTCGADGTCDAVCNNIGQACTQDADCCMNQGMRCADGSIFTPPLAGKICAPIGLPSQAVPNMPGSNYYCQDLAFCEAFDGGKGLIECQLDSVCNPADGGNPCEQDGLVCDQNYSVCRNPSLFDLCSPGGPACTSFGDTTSPMVCSPAIFGQLGTNSVCTFSCQSNADCVEPYMSCITQQAFDICQFSTDATTAGNNCGPGNFNGVCNAAAGNDGVCIAVGGDQVGLCIQAQTDGDGGANTVCNINGNRQIGGLCDTLDICAGNLCQPLCNASSSASASRGGCSAGLDCLPLLSGGGIGLGADPTNDTDTGGACVTPCDFTAVDAGTCGMTASGIPTRCLPAEELGYAEREAPDFCAAGAGVNALALGADCAKAVIGDAIDACTDGTICYGRPATCEQLCEDSQITKTGAAGGCPTGFICNATNFTGTASKHTGVCEPVTDGG